MIANQTSLVNGLLPSTYINPLIRDISLVVLGVAILAISAQFKVPLGPVPVTLQAMVVMMIGGIYGWRLGGSTVLAYVLNGIILGSTMPSVPWFAGLNFPGYAFVGPTAGFLWGFVAAAVAIGFLSDTLKMRDSLVTLFTTMLIGGVLIYATGLLFAAGIYYPMIKETPHSLSTIWAWFAEPFIIGDILKAMIASGLVFSGGAWLRKIRG